MTSALLRSTLALTLLLPAGCSEDTSDSDPNAGAAGTSALASTQMPDGDGTPTGNQVFLLFGQSNMEGVPPATAEEQVEHPRIRVLGYVGNCNGRTYNEWAPAIAPLHNCNLGVGPGYTFSRAIAEAWPNATIDLVPAAISGVDIDFFVKGVVSTRRSEFQIPPDNTLDDAYEMLLQRAQLAQQTGTIAGIIFHQGESDTGQAVWVDKVAGIVADLRADLGLSEDVPFIAGELPYTGCCSSHNPVINRLPDAIPNAHVVSAEGQQLVDQFHFDLPGMREMGRRYATAFLDAYAATSAD